MNDSRFPRPSMLLVGASRGIGLAMAEELLERGWDLVGTVRGGGRTGLHELAGSYPERLVIELVDVTRAEQLAALRERLAPRRFDALFVNAGTANPRPDDTMADIDTEEFVRVMVTNALGPMRCLEMLDGLVRPAGLVGVMSSGQGSVANNQQGGRELYRASKAALNMLMRSYAARQRGSGRSLLVLAPGWIRTELGGPDATFTLEQAVPDIVDCLLAKRERPGLEYLDRNGKVVPW